MFKLISLPLLTHPVWDLPHLNASIHPKRLFRIMNREVAPPQLQRHSVYPNCFEPGRFLPHRP